MSCREVCESCELSRGQGKFVKVVSCREDKVSLRKLRVVEKFAKVV